MLGHLPSLGERELARESSVILAKRLELSYVREPLGHVREPLGHRALFLLFTDDVEAHNP
jgi:hypothetical protein